MESLSVQILTTLVSRQHQTGQTRSAPTKRKKVAWFHVAFELLSRLKLIHENARTRLFCFKSTCFSKIAYRLNYVTSGQLSLFYIHCARPRSRNPWESCLISLGMFAVSNGRAGSLTISTANSQDSRLWDTTWMRYSYTTGFWIAFCVNFNWCYWRKFLFIRAQVTHSSWRKRDPYVA